LDLNAEDFFKALCEDMTERGTSSRELVALEFDPESGEISVLGGVAVHAAGYPALKTILEKIGRACVADVIAVHQLRRITFFGGGDNPRAGFPHREVGTLYVSDRRKAALTEHCRPQRRGEIIGARWQRRCQKPRPNNTSPICRASVSPFLGQSGRRTLGLGFTDFDPNRICRNLIDHLVGAGEDRVSDSH
jgi:hypothetical protein